MLSKIKSPSDLKKLSLKETCRLSDEIRKTIIETVAKNGGHLASNLGIVELTIALHRVFESPKDAIIFDVSHQCYTHKILTGRFEQFSTLRKKDGLSGFTRTSESEHDFFNNGHASTSISQALGLLTARRLQNIDGKVIAVLGDGALTGGMAIEALNHAGQIAKDLIVILNDNQMSISKNTGSISEYLSNLTTSLFYQSFRNTVDSIVDKIPNSKNHFAKLIYRFKRGLKGLFFTQTLFGDLGFEYAGPMDGHNIKKLEKVLNRAKKLNRPVVIHVVTKKGYGYSPAENDPASFHGIGPFNLSDGSVEKFDALSFTECFSNSIIKIAEKNEKICAITAAMSKGTGLDAFSRKFPERFFDCGIAEEHAVTFASGLSKGGLIPVVSIYSTFFQRSVDQIIHDISLPNAHVVLVADRAGVVPNDGETHQGLFDISLMRSVPNLHILSPATAKDLEIMLEWACNKADGCVFIRYPKLACPTEIEKFNHPIETGKGILLENEDIAPNAEHNVNEKCLLITTGSIFPETLISAREINFNGLACDIYSLRFLSDFDIDCEYFITLCKKYDRIALIEDGIKAGGISEFLENLLLKNGIPSDKIFLKAFESRFYAHGNRKEVLEDAGMDSESITRMVLCRH